jgi:hypothetical protein
MRLAFLLLTMIVTSSLHAGKPLPHAQLRMTPNEAAAVDPQMIDVPDSETIGEYQDWKVLQSSKLIAALTENEAGSLFGLMCGSKSCTYYVNASVECAAGDVAPGLISAAAGSMALTLRCAHIREGGEPYAIFLIDEDLSEELADTDEISITVPLANGDVDTSRFSMAGAEDAQAEMLSNAGAEPAGAPRTI